MASVEKRVEELIKPKVEELGYELYDVQYVKEGKDHFLRVFIDSDKGIDLNDCEKVNNGINDILDEADYIKEQYFLEISSTGIEKILRKDEHLAKQLDNEIQIKLFKPVNGKKEYLGKLKEYSSETITILNENEEVVLDRKNISLIKTVYKWN